MKKINIPTSFTPDQRKYLLDLSTEMGKEIADCIGKNESVAQVLLVSPSKKVYSLSVSDAGVVSATLVQE